MGRPKVPVEVRLWKYCNKTDNCWLWTGALVGDKMGYGQILVNGKPRAVHRVSWELAYGDIPKGLQVCHKCDVPLCIRPSHLFLGTALANIRDAVNKGRMHRPLGEDNNSAKLSPHQVLDIRRKRKEGWKHKDLAALFNVSLAQIGAILRREKWTHI